MLPLFLLLILIPYIHSNCIWYEGIRDSFNKVYLNGEPKALPLNDITLLNEMCPHIATREGHLSVFRDFFQSLFYLDVSPILCCDRKQLAEMQKFKYMVDNLIGRCPSCYYNFLRIFCEMACSPDQDQFLWPLETLNITRPNEDEKLITDENNENIRKEWAMQDYVDPDEEVTEEKVTSKPMETVGVISKLRYFMSEKQANDFINSCW
jgi:hypothetical protein